MNQLIVLKRDNIFWTTLYVKSRLLIVYMNMNMALVVVKKAMIESIFRPTIHVITVTFLRFLKSKKT